MRRDFRITRYALFAIALIAIIAFTFQKASASGELSAKVQQWLVSTLTAKGVSPEYLQNAWWNNYKHFRRLAHFFEFFLLGLGAQIAVRSWKGSFLICFGISLANECIKIFLPGREFDGVDMCFEFCGYALGISIVLLIRLSRVKCA